MIELIDICDRVTNVKSMEKYETEEAKSKSKDRRKI